MNRVWIVVQECETRDRDGFSLRHTWIIMGVYGTEDAAEAEAQRRERLIEGRDQYRVSVQEYSVH